MERDSIPKQERTISSVFNYIDNIVATDGYVIPDELKDQAILRLARWCKNMQISQEELDVVKLYKELYEQHKQDKGSLKHLTNPDYSVAMTGRYKFILNGLVDKVKQHPIYKANVSYMSGGK